MHPLLLLNEDTYKTGIGVTGTGAIEDGDHPITYCSNYKGGRMFAQVLGHNWQLFANTAWFQQTIREAILTTAGLKPANCVTHREVRELVADEQAAGGLTADAATAATNLVNAAYDKYATLQQSGYSSSLSEINALRDLAQAPASRHARLAREAAGQGPGAQGLDGRAARLGLGARRPERRRPGDALAVARHAGHVRRVHPGRRPDLHGEHDGQRHLHRG